MKHFRTILVSFVFIALAAFAAWSQPPCVNVLVQAKQMFEDGLIEQIPGLLNPCIAQGFSNPEKLEAYKLLVNAYLFDYNITEAGKTMQEFLKEFPAYKPSLSDPLEFSNLYDEFKVERTSAFGISLGSTFSFPMVSEYYSVDNSFNPDTKYRSSGFPIALQVFYNRRLAPGLEIGVDLLYCNFQHVVEERLWNGLETISFTERSSSMLVPLSLTYAYKPSNAFYPYVRAGFWYSRLTRVEAEVTRGFTVNGQGVSVSSGTKDFSGHRVKNLYGTLLGFGLVKNLNRGYLYLDFRYHFGMTDVVEENSRFSDPSMIYHYGYIDDQFRRNFLSTHLGYGYNLYRVFSNKK
jgi:hypothetical protein